MFFTIPTATNTEISFKFSILSVTLIYPISNVRTIDKIKLIIVNFDSKISEFGIKINYLKINFNIGISLGVLILYFAYMAVYDFYVSLIMYKLYTVHYWFITFIPLMVYSAALCFSFCLLIFIFYRLKLINKILRDELKYKMNLTKKSTLMSKKSKIMFMTLQSEFKHLQENVKSPPKELIEVIKRNDINKIEASNDKAMNLIPNIFHLLHDLVDLGRLVAKFFGPIFLAAFTSIFVVTTIQIYYCYTILYSFDEIRAKTLWTLVSSVNIVLINIVMVLCLTSICECIGNQVIINITLSK